MTAKLIIRRRTHDGMLQEGGRDMLVSLPAPPFPLDVTSDRSETAPTPRMVRGDFDWKKDTTLRHAAHIGKRN